MSSSHNHRLDLRLPPLSVGCLRTGVASSDEGFLDFVVLRRNQEPEDDEHDVDLASEYHLRLPQPSIEELKLWVCWQELELQTRREVAFGVYGNLQWV